MLIDRDAAVKAVPTNWCDALLTGPKAALPPSGETVTLRHVEALLRGVRDRILSLSPAPDKQWFQMPATADWNCASALDAQPTKLKGGDCHEPLRSESQTGITAVTGGAHPQNAPAPDADEPTEAMTLEQVEEIEQTGLIDSDDLHNLCRLAKLVFSRPTEAEVIERCADAIRALRSSGQNKDSWTITRDVAFHECEAAIQALKEPKS